MKRKCTSASQIKSSKLKTVQEPRVNIVDLSDCTLLHVLQFLDATSLYQFGETCTRFQYLVQDKSLWIHVDGRIQPNNADKLAFCWQNVHKRTRHLLLAGSQRSEVVLSLEILIGSEKLNNLTVLALEHQCINYCDLAQFPNTIEELSFKHSYIPHADRFFDCSEDSMSNLKTLILDHCQWFEGFESFIHISNYPKLEILSLYMCKRLANDDVGYIREIVPLRFKSLRVVDLRFAGAGDSFIEMFYSSPSIQLIYFQCFATTYRLERYKRKLDIISGAVINEHSYVSDDEANNDMSTLSFYKRFQTSQLMKYNSYTIQDSSMAVFTRLKKVGSNRTRPKSYLYSYPYEYCTCGFFNKSSGTCGFVDFAKQEQDSDDEISKNVSSSSKTSEDDNEWDPKHLLKKLKHERKRQKINRNRRRGGGIYLLSLDRICGIHMIRYNCCTIPDWCQVQASPSTGTHRWLYARKPRNDYEIAMLEHTQIRRRWGLRMRWKFSEGCAPAKRTLFFFLGDTAINSIDGDDVTESIIKYLIKKTSECIQRLKTNECPENEAMTVVNEFLLTVDECLKKEEFYKFFDDVDFIRQLCRSFYQLSQNVKHNIYYVLNYHFTCFEFLLRELPRYPSSDARKDLLKCFFNNLLLSESRLPILNQDCLNWQKMREVEALPEKKHECLSSGSDSDEVLVEHADINNTEQPPVSLAILVPQAERDTQTNITELSFRGFPRVTDLTLKILKELELDLLDVTGTSVTQLGVQQFMLYNPQCRVIHETACVCPPKLHF